jgi:hypothetical protein
MKCLQWKMFPLHGFIMNMPQAFLSDDLVQGFEPLKHLGFSHTQWPIANIRSLSELLFFN